MRHLFRATASVLLALAATRPTTAQSMEPKWADVERETLEHRQAIVRLDTRNPPGNERRAVEYLKSVFDREASPPRSSHSTPVGRTSSRG